MTGGKRRRKKSRKKKRKSKRNKRMARKSRRRSRRSRKGGELHFCAGGTCPDKMQKDWMKCGKYDTPLSECRMRRGAAMNTNMSDQPYKRLDGGRMWYELNLEYFNKAKPGSKKKKEYATRLKHFVDSARTAGYKGIKQYKAGWWNADYEKTFNNEVQVALGLPPIQGTPGLSNVGQVGQDIGSTGLTVGVTHSGSKTADGGRRRKSRRKKRRKSKRKKSRRRRKKSRRRRR